MVCTHLANSEAVALGLNRNLPDKDTPYPDAWCDECEKLRTKQGEWNEYNEGLCDIKFLCSECYRSVCTKNIKTKSSLADLKDYRWKCGSCDEWHYGPILDMKYTYPYYWSDKYADNPPDLTISANYPPTFLGKHLCAIENEHFFIRGIITLPVIGSDQSFRWGVWGSLSKENFDAVIKMEHEQTFVQLPPMFSWLSTKLDYYPETLSLKLNVHLNSLNEVPQFEPEPTDHPLAQEYYNGISPERVKEIMQQRFSNN